MNARASRFSRRSTGLACLLLLAFAGAAGAAGEQASGLRFGSVPRRLVQRDLAAVVVVVRPSSVRCNLTVRYADRRLQPDLGSVFATNGRATWKFRVLSDAAPGRAAVTASCARAGTVRRSVLVAGSIIPARISVLKSGYSIRNYNYGGAGVSYGLVLKNVSPAQDALQVSVLVNFVGPENKLIGSASSRLDGIPAGAEFALGGDLRFPGGAPIQRLEPVIQIGERAARSLKQAPLANIRVLPSPSDLRWVGSIEGEITNNQPSLVLQHASLSAVVFDSAGNVIGGGTGYVFASLPPNAREFFKLQSGFDAIPIDRVGGAMVSMFGRFEAPR